MCGIGHRSHKMKRKRKRKRKEMMKSQGKDKRDKVIKM
jgi:hypothetical protein